MDKAEEGKEVAIKAVIEGDYNFAADIIISMELEKLKKKGLTEEEAMNLLSTKVGKGEYEL